MGSNFSSHETVGLTGIPAISSTIAFSSTQPLSEAANSNTKKIQVPRNKHENRVLKEANQFEEDDNEDIAYLNFPIIL